MSGLGTGELNLLQTQKLSGVLSYFRARKNDYPLINYFPLVTVDADIVYFDVAKASTAGMTPATIPQTESPIMPMSLAVGGRRTFEAIEWREKIVFTGGEARSIRRLGTHDEEVPVEAVRESFRNVMRRRLDQRMEWMRAQTLTTGGLSVTFAGTTTPFSISYNHPSYLEPNAGTAWSLVATAAPLSDLNTWIELMRPIAHDYRFTMIYNDVVERYLRNNAGIQALANDIFKYTNVSHAVGLGADPMQASNAVTAILNHQLSDSITISRVDSGVDYETDLVATASSGQPSIVVQNVEGFVAGQRCALSDRPNNRFWVGTVLTVTAATHTITFTANLPSAFVAGSRARTTTKYLSDSKVIVVPTYVESMRDDEGDDAPHGLLQASNPLNPNPSTLGEIVSTRNKYLVNDNAPGFFSFVAEESGDPPRVEVVGGIQALPRVDWPERWLIATIA